MTSVDSKELGEYIRSVIEAVKEGTKDTGYIVHGTIDLELAVINKKKAEGGIKIFVVGAKGEYSKDTLSKIKISLNEKGHVGGVLIKSD